MTTMRSLAVVGLVVSSVTLVVTGAEPSAGWQAVKGEWTFAREIVPVVCQGSETGPTLILAPKEVEPVRSCRAVVKVSPDTVEAGVWLGGEPTGKGGLQVLLGRTSNVGGFVLRTAQGEALWEDRFAPWEAYRPYVVEAIRQADKVRVQMFEGTGDVLISQSPWIELKKGVGLEGGALGLFTTDGRARFLRVEQNVEPLSDLVADPPNKRRLQNEEETWDLEGDGQWMWKTAERQRVRQYAACERSWAVCRDVAGTHRVWECRVRVDEGTSGTGMFFLYRDEEDKGFLAWLGGEPGAGTFMLYGYRPSPKALWASPSGRWHWDTEYVLRAETRDGGVRIRQLAADGVTVVSDSNWIQVDGSYTNVSGCLGLHTWRGTAEFWGFMGRSTDSLTVAGKPSVNALGPLWLTLGGGEWKWADDEQTRLVQIGVSCQTVTLKTDERRSLGTTSCLVRRLSDGEAAGVVFQADRRLQDGFVALMTKAGPRLETLEGKILWQAEQWTGDTNGEYRLEGIVMTDRVAMRVYDSKESSRLLIASPDVYVPESNNGRAGYSGAIARGRCEFGRWGDGWFLFAPDE